MPAKIYHVDLTEEEQERLNSIISRRKSNSQIARRCKILLSADRNGERHWNDAQISRQYEVSTRTVERLRERFVEQGLSVALNGKPRLNLDKKKFDGEVEARLVALRCSEPPLGSSRWTLELLAGQMVALDYVESISNESVRQLLKKTGSSLGG